MAIIKTNFTIHPQAYNTSAPSHANEITKEYYDFLVGEINRGTMVKAVCRIEYLDFDTVSYHLLNL